MKGIHIQKICALLSVSIVLVSMLGSLTVPARAGSTEDYVPIKWAVIITGGFDYYRNGWWSYNTIQRLENYMRGRGVPYDLIRDSDLESARNTPSPGKYPLQFADGTPRYQVLVLQTNSYSSVAVANKNIILQAVQSGTNAVLFGKALKVFPELFGLSSSEVLSDDWPTDKFLTVNVAKDFDDGVVNGAYTAGTQISMGVRTTYVECINLNSGGKTVWFNFLRGGSWAIGMMNSTYGDGTVWFNVYDMYEPGLENTAFLDPQWVDNHMGFWAHTINFMLNSAEKISVHIMPFETWKGAWILRTDLDYNSWRAPPPEEVFDAGWKWLEGFCALGYGRVPVEEVTLYNGIPSGYVWSPSEKVKWANLGGVPANDQYRTLVTYKMILYNSTTEGNYDRLRIDFNKDNTFSDDIEYKVWEDITYPDILGTLFWSYISPSFANPTSIGLGWKQTPMLFDGSALTALRDVGENYGNLYTLHSFYHFPVGYDYANAGFLRWDEGTQTFVQDPQYVRAQFEAARASMIQSFDATGYGFESDNVVLHYSGNMYPTWVREVVGQIPWILYEIGGGYGPGGFYKASESTKWMLPCYGSESYEDCWQTYVEAIQTIYPFMAVFQHSDNYNLNFNKTQMRPYTNDIAIANAIDVYDFFINSRTMLRNVTAAYYQNGQVVLDFNAPSDLVHYTWVLPSTINEHEYTGFSDSANVAALKSDDGQNIFIESSKGQGHQILTVNYGPAIPKVTVTVSATSEGTTNPVAGPYQVAQNSVFTVSATASSGYAFDHWVLDEASVGSDNPYSFSVGTTDHTISPIFVAVPTVNVVVSSANGGTTSPVAGQYSVNTNSVFTVSATAYSGYNFDHWTLDGANVGSANPYSFNVGTTDHTISGIFAELISMQIANCDSLTSWVFTDAAGSVDNEDYKEGTGSIVVSPTGTPPVWNTYARLQPQNPMDFSSYSKLEMWIKAADSATPLTLRVATDWNNYNIYTATGLVSNEWAKITIDLSTPTSTVGTVNFDSISFIRFQYGEPAVSLKIDDIRGVLTQNAYTLTVNTVGSGSVTKVPDQATYASGTVVTLTAVPAAGWSFSAWSGGVSGSVNPASVTIDGSKVVTATFTKDQYTLTVNVVGAGCSVTKSPDQATYTYGTSVQLTPMAASGWSFSGWSGDLTGSAVPGTISMTGSKVVTATFTQDAYALTVSTVGSGSVGKIPDQASYHYGDVVQLTASPTAGWSFQSWSGALTGSANPADLTITGDMSVTATFTQNTYTLTVTNSGSGSVNLDNNGPYHYGDTVQLTAVPAIGWSFSVWSGDLSGSVNPTTILVDGNKAVTATFTQNTYTLYTSVDGSGSIDLNSPGPYHYGDVVQFTAVPAIGWSFDHWSQDLTGSSNPATLTITGNMAVTAHFTENTYTLAVNVVGTGCSVSRDNNGPYHYNDVVHLTAKAAVGWTFSQWSGALTGNANPAALTITGDMAVTATFTEDQYTLTITVPGGGGSVNKSPDQATYIYGTIVTLTANPAAGWGFSHWSGDLGGSTSPAYLTIDGDKSVTATFTQNVYTLTISTSGSGSVSTDKSAPYHYGDSVQLTATPAAGWSFQSWSGDVSGSVNPVSVTINGPTSVTATFTQNTYTLTIATVGSGSVNTDKSPPYHHGDVVQLTAVPAIGWSFSVWSGDLSGSVNPTTIFIDGNKGVTATFIQNAYSLTVSTVGSGSVSKVPDQASYHLGDSVQLTATPAAGWSFGVWSGDLTGSQNPTTIMIDGHKTVTATFTQNEYTLDVSIVGSGSVAKAPDQSTYHYNDVVELTAVPNAGWSFSGWSGGLVGNPTSVTITGGLTVTATFTQIEYSLTVNISPVDGGSVSKNPDSPHYHYNDVVQLTATPALGYSFAGWSDGLTGNPTSVTITDNTVVTATFAQLQYMLTINVVGSGSVTQSPDPPYTYGTEVVLAAVPATGWSFSAWSGALTGSTNPASLTVTGDMAVTATFTQAASDFSVSAKPSSRSIAAGSAATYTVTVSLLKGTSQSVSLSCSGLPSGAAASFSPTSGLPTFSSTLKITTTTSTPPGTYIITVTGSSQYISHWTTLQLKIMNFSVAPTPFSPNGDGAKDTTTVTSTFWDTLTWTLTVKNSTGFVIRQLGTGSGSSISIIWDGRDDTGAVVMDGTYTVSLVLPVLTKTGSVVVDTNLPAVTCSWSRSPFNPRSGQTSKLKCTLSEKCSIYIQIYDDAGNLVRTLLAPTTKAKGIFSVTWDGKDDSGVIVPSGTYSCKIFAEDMAGNQVSPYPTTCPIVVS